MFGQLEDGHTLFDYDVGLNDLIQLMIRIKVSEPICASTSATSPSTGESSDESNSSDKENKEVLFYPPCPPTRLLK